MTESKVTIYGAYWCPDCRRSKKFLGEQFIPFHALPLHMSQNLFGLCLQDRRSHGFHRALLPHLEKTHPQMPTPISK